MGKELAKKRRVKRPDPKDKSNVMKAKKYLPSDT